MGVDINRNFQLGWEAATHGQSVNVNGGLNTTNIAMTAKHFPQACSATYPGPSANSEPETKALADFMMQFRGRMKLYVSMHSYASFLLFPYSFDSIYIENWKQHRELCQIFVETVNRITKFDPYTFGHSATDFYRAHGVSDDFAVGVADAEMAIVVELPGGGSQGYDFPEDDLEDLLKETFEGLRQFALYVGENFY